MQLLSTIAAAFLKALGLAEWAAKWFDKADDRKRGAIEQQLQDARKAHADDVAAAENSDDVRRLTDDQLDAELRKQWGDPHRP